MHFSAVAETDRFSPDKISLSCKKEAFLEKPLFFGIDLSSKC